MQMRDFVVRFAGEGGQGVVTSAEGLAQSSTQVGYHALTFATFPSQILGGPTWTQARISVDPVLSAGDDVNVLVAFNREAYDAHQQDVLKDGVVIFNSTEFEIEGDDRSFGLPFEELAKSTGNNRAANMVIMGSLAHLINMPQEHLISFVQERFNRGRTEDAEIIKSNIEALSLGRSHIAESGFSLGELAPPEKPKEQQVMIKGNEAVSVGAMAAGLDFYAGYPISPATPILLYMERNLVGKDRLAYQVSSEIEAITAIIGAGYAGKRAMTATSGPGVSLMSEGLGLAWIAEIPLVVVNVQRGGPATGLPTKTEQSDLFGCMFPAHGDVKIPIIAAGTVEECFYGAVKAIEWAEKYQGPVILLSEMALAERVQNITKPDLSKIQEAKRVEYTGSNGYLRYAGDELSPMPIPGNPGAYVANGSEHDHMGDTTHLGEHHVHMTERRFSKVKLLESDDYESDQTENSIAILPRGGSNSPAQEAYNDLKKAGLPVSWYYTMFLNPLPPKMLEELKNKDRGIVHELNCQGQVSNIRRSMDVIGESITHYTRLPFKDRTLVEKVTEMTKANLWEATVA